MDQIKQLSIQLYEDKLNVFLNNKVYNRIDEKIYDKIKETFLRNHEVVLIISKAKFIIKKYSVTVIDFKLIRPIIDEWSKKASLGVMVEKNYNNLNDVEKKYLDGIYDYFIACNTNGANKGERYLSAFGILDSFNPIDPIGLLILKIICFRLNWIDKLDNLCDVEDEFHSIFCFFKGEKKIFNICDENISTKIFVEDEIINSINSIINYQNGDIKKVDAYLSELSVYDIDDINLRDRVLLLKCLRAKEENKRYKSYLDDITEERFVNLIKYNNRED